MSKDDNVLSFDNPIDNAAVRLMNRVAVEFMIAVGDGMKQMIRPSVLYRPELTQTEGLVWKAQYGAFFVFGATPGIAMSNFDAAWMTRKNFDANSAC